MNLTTYLQAGYPGLAIVSSEEARLEAEVATVCKDLERKLLAWSSTEGLVDTQEGRVTPCPDPLDALELLDTPFNTDTPRLVVLLRDLQLYLDQNDPQLLRRLKDSLRLAKGNGHTVLLLGCRLKLPPELKHEITVIDYQLPSPAELQVVLDGIIKSAELKRVSRELRESALQSALGLTTTEAENAFALSIIESKGINPTIIAREKANTLKRSGLLEVIPATTSLADIGGLNNLKQWLQGRAGSFHSRAVEYGLPSPKGLLIVGLPGTGKSLTAKATAGAFGLPLLRLDMGRVFGGVVGQSEANLRTVVATAEAIAPCVLWIDEIEKGFSGSKSSGSTDGGTSSRVFGSFLSWMQEKEKPVFVVATANDVSQLPPEFLRKGRFDEMFFVDLPDTNERTAIWDIVIGKYGRKPTDYDPVVLAQACEQFTGAEIEAVFVDALHAAFAEGREPVAEDILTALLNTVPLAQLMDGKIASLRHWAKGRAREAGNSTPSRSRPARRIDPGAN
ncbi:AAA family ATPase [Roseibacillus persicicus]|uniref:AAA family ATPase n=1 Tax=Roseibacillus persicicus TaxID=454148 RepID=UPI00280EA6E1|nr:AAA family ATPase [Roseibacillus persicicus]MDQ8192613.1 AAA family ATPase [Roseibacillus persicicus]